MSASDEVSRLLREHGAVLKRSKKHQVWQLPNGNTFVCASAPSDRLAADNQLTGLRKALGIANPDRGKPGKRRARKEKHDPLRRWKSAPTINTAFAEQLSRSGVVQGSLCSRIVELERDVARKRRRCWWRWLKTAVARLWAA